MKKPIALLLCASLLACMSSTSVFAADESFPLENEETVSEEIASDEIVSDEIVPEAVSSGVPDETEVFGPTEGDLANFTEDESASEEELEEFEEESEELEESEGSEEELEEQEEDPEESNLSGEFELSDEVLEPDREIEPIEEALTYKFEISWKGLEFTYHPKTGTWDPRIFNYNGNTEAYWSYGSITVECTSKNLDTDVDLAFSFEQNYDTFPYATVDMVYGRTGDAFQSRPRGFKVFLNGDALETTVYVKPYLLDALDTFTGRQDMGDITLTISVSSAAAEATTTAASTTLNTENSEA